MFFVKRSLSHVRKLHIDDLSAKKMSARTRAGEEGQREVDELWHTGSPYIIATWATQVSPGCRDRASFPQLKETQGTSHTSPMETVLLPMTTAEPLTIQIILPYSPPLIGITWHHQIHPFLYKFFQSPLRSPHRRIDWCRAEAKTAQCGSIARKCPCWCGAPEGLPPGPLRVGSPVGRVGWNSWGRNGGILQQQRDTEWSTRTCRGVYL